MSIEYTIDIQLTELGFPDILQPDGASERETTLSESSHSPSHSPTAVPPSHKQRLLVRGQKALHNKHAVKQTSSSEHATALPCRPLKPAQSLQDEQAVEDTAPADLSRTDLNAGGETADVPQLVIEEDDSRDKDVAAVQQDMEDDSDDSEVSEVYEEEEADEEEGDEERLSPEPTDSGDYQCSVCDLMLPSEFKLQDHMNLHTGARPYCCAECGKRFCQIYNYRVHLRTHAQTKVDRLMCRICLMCFVSQKDLENHLSNTHLEDEFYECDLCKRVFVSLKACENHVQLHKSMLICEVCGRNFSTTKSLVRHQKRTCCRNFKCTDCTKIFMKKNALLKHSFSHLGLLPYTCVRCHRHFRLAKLYRQHKCEPDRIHCVACLREFLSQEDFKQHKKDTGCWGNQEPKGDEIRCLECGQRFDTSAELKKHAGAHQRVLKCAECGKGFRSALLLMSHMGGHAGKSPCLCQNCGLGFPHQQNYDSHLKTCGQTPPPVSTSKKRSASKSSSPRAKKLKTIPDSSNPKNTITTPADVLNDPVSAAKDSPGPSLVTGVVPADSGPPDGLWKLTLNKQPPPGVKLVLFLPVSPAENNVVTFPSTVSPPPAVLATQVQSEAALPSVSTKHPGAFGLLPLDLITRNKHYPECEAPLDLSKKFNSSKSTQSDISPLSIKNEQEEFEISGERREFKRGHCKMIMKTNSGDADTEVRQSDPMDLSTFNVKTTSSGLIQDVKEEPQSPGSKFDSWSSRSCQLTKKEIKMEVDLSFSSCDDIMK